MTGLYTKLAGLCPENAVHLLNISPARRDPLVTSLNEIEPKNLGEKISETPSGHHIYHAKQGSNSLYRAYNPHTKNVDLRLETYPGSAWHNIGELSGRQGSTLPAHDFYHHLITHHGLTLSTHSQSLGGKKVWHRLSQKPDISMHGWDPRTGKIHEIDPNDEQTTHRADKKANETEHDKFIRRLLLVAHQKTPPISLAD